MNRALIAVAAVGIAGAAVAYLTYPGSRRSGPTTQAIKASQQAEHAAQVAAAALKPDPGWEGIVIPAFAGMNQDGQPVDQTMLEGKVTVLDFIFTHCPLACPAMTAQMQALTTDLAGTPVRFASLGLDPKRDTPAVFRQYADQMGADTTRWTFMSGDEKQIRDMIKDPLMFEVSEDTSRPITLEDGSTMFNIIHPTQFFLIGPKREVLGIFAPTNPEDLNKLVARAKAAGAAVAAGSGR